MSRNRERRPTDAPGRWRAALLQGLFLLAFLVLLARAVDLQVLRHDFLVRQASARHLRTVEIPAHRGTIRDRHGETLALSTPMATVWANPKVLLQAPEYWPALARILGERERKLARRIRAYADREFVYLRRQVPPDVAQRVHALRAPGVGLAREYHRYYPAGEVAAHVVGFTDVDDVGREGMELAYDRWLRGTPGKKRVVRDGRHRIVDELELIRAPRPGRDLVLSIDLRIQYLAYRALKAAVRRHRARAGSAVVLDVRTGEVLAMVNQPSWNPNDRRHLRRAALRNRAVTDVFEPGSTMKPFAIAAALLSGRYRPDSRIDTRPGWLRVGRYTIHDVHDYGVLDLTGILRKSSNVGVSKIALSLPRESLWGVLQKVGFGQAPGLGFPGEAAGFLSPPAHWHRVEQATLAFGYGLSVSALQLARAYAVLAHDGRLLPVSLVRRAYPPEGTQVLPAAVARQVRHMLEAVVSPEGTAPRARIAGYRVAGKTGTVRKAVAGGYAEDRYLALFVGMAPASRPRLVCVVAIDEPGGETYYGGTVAAPVFQRILSGALRLLNVPPDAPRGTDAPLQAAMAGGPA
ncbi:MAG: penicillin-binding protein 2 [Gammaproteobacteria bacterium]|nr:MAG: penicillin-binding protein 2 [Gammaproteobacteria bacterium]